MDIWATREQSDTDKIEEKMTDYRRFIVRKWILIASCIVATFLVSGYALTIGDYSINFWDTYCILWDHIIGNITDPVADYVMWDLRAPRIVTGIIVGGALGATGAVMQSILRNPLADPYTTGISSGASFGATVALALGVSAVGGSAAVIVNAFIFAIIPMIVIIMVAKLKSSNPTTMIMAGIAVMYIFNAMTTIIKLMSDETTLASIFAWSVGSIDMCKWESDVVMFWFVTIGLTALMFLSRKLNVLSTGDESARTMGVDAGKLRIICLLVVTFVVASVVSFTGLIGFIGLVCPHIVRLIIGSDNRYLIPASAVFGSALILIADTVGRVIVAPAVIQVGVVTAFIGAPLFLYLIIKQKTEVW